ncbi:MAG TPA: hypothetical protein VK638_23125, partial [Edaphobacter sp.]|nr:hypothetical protein [Edaphobacter sp.]
AGAVAVQPRPQVGDRLEEGDVTRVEGAAGVEAGIIHIDLYAAHRGKDTKIRATVSKTNAAFRNWKAYPRG